MTEQPNHSIEKKKWCEPWYPQQHCQNRTRIHSRYGQADWIWRIFGDGGDDCARHAQPKNFFLLDDDPRFCSNKRRLQLA